MKRMVCLAAPVLVALLIVMPATAAVAQEDEDIMAPEPNAVVIEDEDLLQQVVGEPLPSTGGLEVGTILLPAAVLLLGTGVLAYIYLRRTEGRR